MTASAPDTALTSAEAIALLHPFVDRAASELGMRILFIKGPALTSQGLRAPQASVDVDVLADPSRVDDLLSRLGELGWHVPVKPTSAQVLPLHSTTLRHKNWGCELDVHDRFPGFLAEPQEVFEVLWEHRTAIAIAHRDVQTLEAAAHAAVAALHWLRDGEDALTSSKLDFLVTALREQIDEPARSRLASVAERTGAAGTLRPLLERLAIDTEPTTYDDTDWRIRAASTGVKGVGWVAQFRHTPLRRLPAHLVHALLLTEAEIRHEQPDAAPGAWGLFRARLHRLRYGLRDLPRAVRIVWREEHRS